jgi:hypothetical protein
MDNLFTGAWEIPLYFFAVAALYSSVGFGGGSSYLAILALYGLEYRLVRATALLCNIVVVTAGTWIFYKNGHLNLRKAMPLVLASVPLAFLGGLAKISEKTFFILLAIALLAAGVLMLAQSWLQKTSGAISQKTSPPTDAALGGSIGFLSGMVGIGGGIFLAPLLHLLRWDTAKNIAATASFFILANSISGLFGQLAQPDFHLDWQFAGILITAVFLGGQVGSRLGAVRLPQKAVRVVTAIMVIYVAANLLLKYR